MLKEITLKEAIKLMEEGAPVYGVNLENEDKQLVDLRHLFTGVRILADLPEPKKTQGGGVKGKRGRPKKESTAEEIAATIDSGKVGALRKAGWPAKEIAAEFGVTEETMKEVIKILESK